MTLHEIERLERLGELGKVHSFRFKELKKNEISRTTYNIFASKKIEAYLPSLDKNKWTPLTIISLIGGLSACIGAILMFYHHVNIVGYDTYMSGGYSYETLTPPGVLLLGIFILIIGIIGIPKKKK